MTKELSAIFQTNYVPFVSASSSHDSSTSSKDSVIGGQSSKRSEIKEGELRRNPLHRSAETRNKNKNDDDKKLRSELLLQDLPDRLQEFRENLVDESVPAAHLDTSSPSHELPLEPWAKVEPGLGNHSIFTHFPKGRNCDICLTFWYNRAQSGNFWWFNNRGSQSSQWSMRIPTQSSIRYCGTRFCNSVVTILPMQSSKTRGKVFRETETPEAEASLRNSINRFILPNVNSIKRNRDVSLAQRAHSRSERLKNNQPKGGIRVMTKVQLLLLKVYDSWVVYRRTLSFQILQQFLKRAQKCWSKFDEHDARGLCCVRQTSEKIKVHRLVKYESKFTISDVFTIWSLWTDLQERLKDKSDAPAEMRGHLPRTFF